MLSTWFNPVTTGWFLAVVLALVALWRPTIGRMALGGLFLLAGLVANLIILLVDSSLFVEVGRHSFLGVYRWFFETVVAAAPAVWGVAVIMFETAAGVLTLFRRYAKVGLVGIALFTVAILPFGQETLPNVLLAMTALWLARTHDVSPPVAAAR
ncbi:MAG TPA: hypothetical protein VD902_10620 [Symbiobacteriaceae bacterium]|nr:hypothetical protein [Symbiobacteriaceae bacterium]